MLDRNCDQIEKKNGDHPNSSYFLLLKFVEFMFFFFFYRLPHGKMVIFRSGQCSFRLQGIGISRTRAALAAVRLGETSKTVMFDHVPFSYIIYCYLEKNSRFYFFMNKDMSSL